MSKFIKELLAFCAICAVAVLCLSLPRAAAPADKNGAPEASEPKDGAPMPPSRTRRATTPTKPKTKQAREAPPPDAKAEDAPPAGLAKSSPG